LGLKQDNNPQVHALPGEAWQTPTDRLSCPATRPDRRQRFRGTASFGLYIAAGWLLPGRKRIIPYSIQTLKRLKPALFRQDLVGLFELLRRGKIEPIIAHRFPLAGARLAHELLEWGGVTGKIVLGGPSLGGGAA